MIYNTVLGDTWDTIAYAIYGDETKAQALMEERANILLLDTQVFGAGVKITAPDIPAAVMDAAELPIWRS